MKIEHKTLKIKKTNKISTDYIENCLHNLGFQPLRWAITKVEADFYTVDCAVILNE